MVTWELLAIIGAVVAGGLVQGITGFGFGLLTLPTFGMFMPEHLPQIILLLSGPSVLIVVWQERLAVKWRSVARIVSGRVVGTLPGVAIVTLLPGFALGLTFATLTLAACSLLAHGSFCVEPTPSKEYVAGGFSGLMATAAGLGGPPVALLYSGAQIAQLRGIMSTTLLLGNMLSLAALIGFRRVGVTDLYLVALLLLPLAAGFAVGNWVSKLVDASRLRPYILGLIAANAVSLMIKSGLPLLG